MPPVHDPALRRSPNKKLLLALPVLLVLAVVVNLGSLTEIVKGKRNVRSVLYGLNENHGSALAGWKMPPDSGAADAKVVVEVFLMSGESCHVETAFAGQALGTLDPKRIRVKYVDGASGKAAAERREKVKLGCDQGVAVNGKTEFKIPDPASPGKKKTVFTAHKHGGAGGAAVSLYHILDQELKAAYHGKGLGMAEAQFDQKIKDESGRVRDAALAEAKARKEAEKRK
jgi:hypothetical protein